MPGKVTTEDSSDLAHAVDLFPTIVSAAGGTPPEELPGIDLLDANARLNRKSVYGVVHVTHNMTLGDPNDTLQYIWCIEGKWKLIKRFHGTDVSKYKALHQWDQEPFHLYDLSNDPHEKDDLMKKLPKVVSKMDQMIDDWLQKTSQK